MAIRRLVELAGWAALAVVLATALILRVVGLGTIPEPNADEAFFGIQATRLVAGENAALWTHSGLLVSPVQVGLLLPWLAVFEPGFWILRMPATVCGLLAIALTFLVGPRVLDRETALIAGTTFAVLPIAILYARDGCEYGLTPPAAAISLLIAFGGKGRALFVACVAGLMIHPTNILLGPCLLGVYVARTWALFADPRDRNRRVILSLIAAILCLLVVGGLTLGRMGNHGFYTLIYQPPDWPQFVQGLGRYLAGAVLRPGPPTQDWWGDAAFWGFALVIGGLGGLGLVRDRRWDRLALVIGLGVSIAALHVLTGPGVFSREVHRYAAWLVAPSVLAFAVLAREALRVVERVGSVQFRVSASVLGLGLAGFALAQVGRDHFGFQGRADGAIAWGKLAARPAGTLQRIHDYLREAPPASPRDTGGNAAAGRVVVADNWWFAKPLEYLGATAPDLSVVAYDRPGPDAERRLWNLLQVMEAGGCAVGFRNSELIAHVEALFPAGRLDAWEADPVIVVYRVRPAQAGGPRAAKALDPEFPPDSVAVDHSTSVIR